MVSSDQFVCDMFGMRAARKGRCCGTGRSQCPLVSGHRIMKSGPAFPADWVGWVELTAVAATLKLSQHTTSRDTACNTRHNTAQRNHLPWSISPHVDVHLVNFPDDLVSFQLLSTKHGRGKHQAVDGA